MTAMLKLSGFRTRATLWGSVSIVVALLALGTMWWASGEPPAFDVKANAASRAERHNQRLVTGYVTTATLIRVARTLLDKPGGYLSNDVMPPWIFLDNIPNWEFGALVQVRDLTRALRNDFSRSQTQSLENYSLAKADPQFHIDNASWILPRTESEYRKGLAALGDYIDQLADPAHPEAQFYARADNLRDWLAIVEKRLGGLGQRLSASVGQERINTDLAGDRRAQQSTASAAQQVVKTPWLEIDDVFYEARGATWALLHFLKAMESDLADVLADKNAEISLRQIIRELEAAQRPLGSPIILNGKPYGMFANHSLVMANYIARANAALIDLRRLLAEG